MFRTTLCYHTWSGSGWKVLICNEADNMSEKASFLFLDILEHLPKKTVVIFTTNDADKLPRRLRERCERYAFKSQVNEETQKAAQALIAHVWETETGHSNAPQLADLDGWKEDFQLSYRGVLKALEPCIRAAKASETVLNPLPVAPVEIVQETAIESQMRMIRERVKRDSEERESAQLAMQPRALTLKEIIESRRNESAVAA